MRSQKLVDPNLAKVGVASSSLVFRSRRQSKKTALFFCISTCRKISATLFRQNEKICHSVENPKNSPKEAVSTAFSNPLLPIDSPIGTTSSWCVKCGCTTPQFNDIQSYMQKGRNLQKQHLSIMSILLS